MFLKRKGISLAEEKNGQIFQSLNVGTCLFDESSFVGQAIKGCDLNISSKYTSKAAQFYNIQKNNRPVSPKNRL